MSKVTKVRKIGFTNYYTAAIQLGLLLVGLYFTSLHSYLLFHSLVELSGVIIAGVIALIVWNARRYIDNGFFVLLGISFLFIGGLSLLHVLSYEGMNIFRSGGANLSTQIWIASRYMMAISFVLAALLIRKKFDIPLTIILYSVVFLGILASIFYLKSFPTVYIDGAGLTIFKKESEYVISLLFGFAALLIYVNGKYFDRRTRRILIASIIFSVASELSLTEYISPYGSINLIGHLFLIISFYLIYLGIVEIALRRPSYNLYYNLAKSRLFMKRSEYKLRKMNETLEEKVRIRTYELQKNNEELNARNLLMKLASQADSRKHYLHELIRLIKAWSGCEFAGVRVLNDEGNIPYNAYIGFDQKFWEAENWISSKNDQCICGRVMQGTPDALDLRMMSDAGSFHCNNAQAFFTEMSEDEKIRFRGNCAKQGFMSLAVVPIWYGQRVIGLMHFADKLPNVLTNEKIKFIESLSPLIGSSIHKYNTQDSLDKSTRALAVLSEGNHILIHSKNEKILLDGVCKMIVERGGYVMAWIGYANLSMEKKITPVAQAGISRESLIQMIDTIKIFKDAKGSAKEAIITGKPQVRKNILNDPELFYLKEVAIKNGFKSSIALPLKNGSKNFGVVTIYAKESVAFDKKEIILLEELVSDMSFGINNLRIRDAKERSEKQLIESYEHLGFINRKISTLLDLDKNAKNKKDAGNYVLETAINLSQADLGFLYKFDQNGNFNLVASSGLGKKVSNEFKIFSKESYDFLKPMIADKTKLEVRSDIYNLGCFSVGGKVRCYLIIPLFRRNNDKLKGALFLGYKNDKKLFEQELEFYDVFKKHAYSALIDSKVI